MSGFAPLELQILSINVIGLAGSTLSWLKWDQQLGKISNFSVLQSDELEVKDVDWLKTILSWVVVARFVIDRVSLLAYVANIYTIVTRSWQNLLILWMVLSFLKDIVLEVVVIITTSLLWYKGSVSTLLLVEFIAEKTIWLIVSTCKWCTTLKWYMQLRRVAKIRKFSAIARRSIANIVNIPGRVGRSLDDECLGVAIARRGKYASLLNLDRLSESSNRVNFISLKTLITDDSHDTNDTNDYDPNGNDLSVAEKSMKMLRITAEDVMDARARIQERPYWSEKDVAATTSKATEEVGLFPLERDGESVDDASKSEQKYDIEKIDRILKKEDVMQYPLVEKKGEKDNNVVISIDMEEQILIWKQAKENGDLTLDKIDNLMRSTESRNFCVASERMEEAERVVRFVQCPLSKEDEDARNMEVNSSVSLVRKLEAELCPILVNQQRKQIEQIDQRRYPCQFKTQLMSTDSDADKKEHYYNPKASSSTCYRTLHAKASRNGRELRSADVNDKNIKHGIDGKEFRRHIPIDISKRGKVDGYISTFKYSEAYRLKKQIQKCESICGKSATWGSMSLAETARPSGYARDIVAADRSSIRRKNVRTEIRDDSSDSLSVRYKLKYVEQVRSRRAFDLHSIYNVTSLNGKNRGRSGETTDARALKTRNGHLPSLENKGEIKARRRHDLPANLKLSIEEREAIELRALRAYNELTLLEDKKELETRKKRDSSNYEQPTKEPEVSGMKVLNAYNDVTLPGDKKEMEITGGHNLSHSCRQSVDESDALKVRNEFTLSEDEEKLQARNKHVLSKDEMLSKCEEDIKNPSSSNRLSEINSEETTILSSETRQNANNRFDLNDRYVRQAHMSLNLREITRNIEWTAHPRGIVLINKNLHTQFPENERLRESQERDIVDDNIASMLHSAFFFKPEIVTRVFRRAQTRIGESLASFPTFWREDFNMDFVCRLNNEMIVRDRDSSSDFDLERIMGDSNNLRNSLLPDTNGNRVVGEENSRDLCIIFIDRQQVPAESETAIIEDSSAVGSQENARLSIESIQTANILVLDGNHDRTDNVTNDNLPVQLILDILRNFGVEVSERNTHAGTSSVEQIEEYGDVSNVIARNNFQRQKISVDDTNSDDENNNESDKISLHKSADIDETIREIAQTLNSNSNSDNVGVTSSVELLERNNSRDERKLSASNIYSENKIHKNNLSLTSADNNAMSQLSDYNNNESDTLINKTEKDFDRILESSSRLCFPGPSSFIESDNCRAILRSSTEELKKLTQLSDSEVLLEDQRTESVLNVETVNHDTVSQFRNVEASKLETTAQDSARSDKEDRDTYEKENEFSTHRLSKISSDERLRQYDSFYSMYERNDDNSETPISLEDSLMEEFSNDAIPPEMSSDVSAKTSALFCNF